MASMVFLGLLSDSQLSQPEAVPASFSPKEQFVGSLRYRQMREDNRVAL